MESWEIIKALEGGHKIRYKNNEIWDKYKLFSDQKLAKENNLYHNIFFNPQDFEILDNTSIGIATIKVYEE